MAHIYAKKALLTGIEVNLTKTIIILSNKHNKYGFNTVIITIKITIKDR